MAEEIISNNASKSNKLKQMLIIVDIWQFKNHPLNGWFASTNNTESIMSWTTQSLFDAMYELDVVTNGEITITRVGDCLAATMHEYGDLPVVISTSENQMLMESVLFPVAVVKDKDALNDEFLRNHKYLPLSTVAIETFNGEDHYVLFGALSATSTLENVMLELTTLADNVLTVAEACEAHIARHPVAK